MMAWYKEWFGEEYLELYAHRGPEEAERHADFFESLVGDEGAGRILDLACGAGRHTESLRRRGHDVLGTDLSLTLLRQSVAPRRVAADMRSLPFAPGSFDWLLNLFTSFGYFETERQNFRVLEEIGRVLVPGGRFLIDLMNLEATLAHLEPYEERKDGDRRVEIRRWWDEATGRINKRIRLFWPGREPRTFLESVRAYRPDEVTIGLRWAGLEVTDTFGDFSGDAYTRDSERLILVGRKAE